LKVLGLTVGIASIGWALLNFATGSLTILAAGVWTFDAPETPKEHTPLNAIRRLYRGQRRVIRRRRQRMNEVRRVFHEAGLLASSDQAALSQKGLDPWRLRAEAFERQLTGPELAIALGHIAVHRGFQSNSKRDQTANAPDETSRMMKSLAEMQERLQRYRTVGLMFAAEPDLQERKRNRGDFSRSVLRADLTHEVREIFAEQRRRSNPLASADLEESFARIAFWQRPLQDAEAMVGACRFEPAEKRTARRGYGFELFRLLSRLANLTLSHDGIHARLTPAMIRLVVADFGAVKRISYKSVRTLLALDPTTRFVGVADKDEKQDVVARQGNAADGTYALRHAVGPEQWSALMQRPVLRDRIAEVLTHRSDTASIRAGLQEAGCDDALLAVLMHGHDTGAFRHFTGTGHLSAKASRALLPALRRGVGYAAACTAVGYDHDAAGKVSLDDLRNPVVRKALTEILKQLRAIVGTWGQPDAIHIALARDLGKSVAERDAITSGIEKQNQKREKSRKELEGLLERSVTGDELLRYELWKEQGGRCLYTDTYIEPGFLARGDNTVQAGHILPWSRFGDDGFPNRTLCMTSVAHAKKDRTPYEWFQQDGLDWAAFSQRVSACKEMKDKKKNLFYLRQNAREVEDDFRSRQLNDTRYIARFLLLYLGQTYPDVRRIHARPIQLIAKLRRAWGLDDLKHDANRKRIDDPRHRALDAIILTTISDSVLEDLTRAAHQAERQGLARGFDFKLLEPPAEGFREMARGVVETVFVARAERRRVSGETHAATIKSVRSGVVFERKAVANLTLADLENIPVPDAYGKVAQPERLRNGMVDALRQWIEAGRPKDALPRSPKGDVIRKVRLNAREGVRVTVRGGTADRGEMARVDVFTAPNGRGVSRFFLVPIYPHQIMDRVNYPQPPARAVSPSRAESDWTEVDDDGFLFSLYSHSLIEIVKSDGEVVRGYFKGLDRSSGAIGIAVPEDLATPFRRVGAKTLAVFRKLRVDRVGRVTAATSERRTWHGVSLAGGSL
jgi:CRISPR-associated endonuclease Csn1